MLTRKEKREISLKEEGNREFHCFVGSCLFLDMFKSTPWEILLSLGWTTVRTAIPWWKLELLLSLSTIYSRITFLYVFNEKPRFLNWLNKTFLFPVFFFRRADMQGFMSFGRVFNWLNWFLCWGWSVSLAELTKLPLHYFQIAKSHRVDVGRGRCQGGPGGIMAFPRPTFFENLKIWIALL